MPKEFDECVKNGGKVHTISGPRSDNPQLEKNEYVHVCTIKEKSYMGHIKTKHSLDIKKKP